MLDRLERFSADGGQRPISIESLKQDLAAGKYGRALLRYQLALAGHARPSAGELLLRARLLERLGHRSAALKDLFRALDRDPDNGAVLSAFLDMAGAADRLEAARSLLNIDGAAEAEISKALNELLERGVRLPWWSTERRDMRVLVVAVLGADGDVVLDASLAPHRGRLRRTIVDTDSGPLRLYRTVLKGIDAVGLRVREEASGLRLGARPQRHEVAEVTAGDRDVTVIVPFHDAPEHLEVCADSVLRELRQTPRAQLILVDDASRRRKSEELVTRYRRESNVTIIRNEVNCGFVASVNRALGDVGAGDVLLLNSDTYLPPNCLRLLSAHARRNADVATVTPLSNNAGTMTVPDPDAPHGMPSPLECDRIARFARSAHRDRSIDILHGNGFAMLITETARKRLGGLSLAYQHGYYEEVDYGLRAREAGLRNLCAGDVFVGHVGNQSFAGRKAWLAARNLDQLRRRFPAYEDEFDRFRLLDPLAAVRASFAPVFATLTEVRPKRGRGSLGVLLSRDSLEAGSQGHCLMHYNGAGADRLRAFFRHILLVNPHELTAHGLCLDAVPDWRMAAVGKDAERRLVVYRSQKKVAELPVDAGPAEFGALEAELLGQVDR